MNLVAAEKQMGGVKDQEEECPQMLPLPFSRLPRSSPGNTHCPGLAPVSLHCLSSAPSEASAWTLAASGVCPAPPAPGTVPGNSSLIHVHLINGCHLSGLAPQRSALLLRGCPQILMAKPLDVFAKTQIPGGSPQNAGGTTFGDHPGIFIFSKFIKHILDTLMERSFQRPEPNDAFSQWFLMCLVRDCRLRSHGLGTR